MLQAALFVLPGKRQAVAELIFAAFIWGFSFVCAKWVLGSMGPLWATSIRFVLPSLVILPFVFARPWLRAQAGWGQFMLAAVPGILLGLTLVLQNSGLLYTTVTKSGFITVLYVVFVPLLEGPLFGNRVPLSHGLWVALALLGTALICRLDIGDWNRGDLLTLACSVIATGQILALQHASTRIQSSFVFNLYQAVWAGILPTIFAVPFDTFARWPLPWEAIGGLLILSFGVTMVGFLIQVRTQRVLQPSIVSMLFLLESPIAAFFAYLVFGETLTPSQWIGGFLIMVAAMGSIRSQVL